MASYREASVPDSERIVDTFNKASEVNPETESNTSNVAAGTASLSVNNFVIQTVYYCVFMKLSLNLSVSN